MQSPKIAYVADGKLFVRNPAGPPQLVESTFVQQIADRLERDRQRGGWKTGNMAWQFSSRPMAGVGLTPPAAEIRKMRFAGVASGPNANEILYAIETDHACGLFHLEIAEGYERRLYHRNEFNPGDLARDSQTGNIALSLHMRDGTAHLAILGAEGKGLREITQGDAVDEAPSWSPLEKNTLFFQSAGVARNQQGVFTGVSTYAIHKIDLDAGKMTIALEEDDNDLLLPRQTPDGNLFFIRRPYQPFGAPVSLARFALDAALFPFRLANAVVHFFNAFSLFFTKKPLITAGGPPREGPDQRLFMLYGRLIDLRQIQRDARKSDAADLVPDTWQLIRRAPDGGETVLARHVAAYDLRPGGGFVYTTGSRIFSCNPNAEPVEICRASLIDKVIAFD
jgi:hypothetical protein